MYKADRFFMKQLKDLDPRLGCHYNSDIHRFVIAYERLSTDEPVPIIVVSKDEGFRYPDRREINILHESDQQRVSMKEQLERSAKYMEDYRNRARIASRENLRLMTIDDRRQLRRAVGKLHGPKVDASMFRKIIHKPRGQVF